MKYLIAGGYFCFFCAALYIFGRINIRSLIYGLVMLTALILFSVFNDSSAFIDEKVASFVSYDMYKEGRFTLTFFVQYILAWIPIAVLDYEYSAHGLNIGMQAFVFMLGAQYLFGVKASWQLFLFSMFPSYYHYAIFGLRDPLINFVAVIVAIGALNLGRQQFVLLCMGLSILSIGIRPEFSLIIAGFAGLRLFFGGTRKQKIVIGIVGLAGIYAALLVMPLAFGIGTTGSAAGNIEAMISFNELRNARRLGGDGSGSHILGGSLFSYPFPVRYPIQAVASFVAPLPFEIRGQLDLLAFGESTIFCFVAALALRAAWKHPEARLLFACAMAYMLLQALFAFNYGNVLRVRYPALVFFLATTVAPDVVRARAGRSARRQSHSKRARLASGPP